MFRKRTILVYIFIYVLSAPLYGIERNALVPRVHKLAKDLIRKYKRNYPDAPKVTVAVLDFENIGRTAEEMNIGPFISDMVNIEFAKNGDFELVERSVIKKKVKKNKYGLMGDEIRNAVVKGLTDITRADMLLAGSVAEFGDNFIINTRMVGMETGWVMVSAETKVKLPRTETILVTAAAYPDAEQKVRINLEALNIAINNYSIIKTVEERKVVWPPSLEALVPEYLSYIPDPETGRWAYDPKTGAISNTAYPDMKPQIAYMDKQQAIDAVNKTMVDSGISVIKNAITLYFVENGQYPEKLVDLVDTYIAEIPAPPLGGWEYDSSTGEIVHSESAVFSEDTYVKQIIIDLKKRKVSRYYSRFQLKPGRSPLNEEDTENFNKIIYMLVEGGEHERYPAAYKLHMMKNTEAIAPLIYALGNDTENSIRHIAAKGLGRLAANLDESGTTRLRKKDAVGALIKALSDPEVLVRTYSAEALGIFKDERAIKPLIELLKDDEQYVKLWTVYALKNITGGSYGKSYEDWNNWWKNEKHKYR